MPRETMADLRLRLEASEVRASRWKAAIDELLAADAELEQCSQPGAYRTAAMKRYARAFKALREVG